jgi:hypothetical protein
LISVGGSAPQFSSGYRRRRCPAQDGRRFGRLIDLTALCGLLAEEDTPEAVVAEVMESLTAT